MLEGVPWKEVEYQDNSACIDLLEKPPNGIFRLLDSQCKAPNASEEALCKELNQLHAKGGFLAPPRLRRMRDEEGFIVRHYAGDVAYHSSAVVAKATGSNEARHRAPGPTPASPLLGQRAPASPPANLSCLPSPCRRDPPLPCWPAVSPSPMVTHP